MSKDTRSGTLLDQPAIAIGLTAVIYVLALCATIHHPLAFELPTASFGGWPEQLLLNRLHLDWMIGRRLASSFAQSFSLLLFLLDCIAVIVIARRWPKARDAASVVGGTAWVLAAAGWRFPVCILAVAALVHYGFRRMNSHLSMVLTTALLMIAFKFFIRIPIFTGNPFMVRVSIAATWHSMLLGALRLIMYAFETSSVSRGQRSFLTVLAYSPLGIFLWPANPPMTSYLTYATKAPQSGLDRRASRQLYRSGFKYLLIVCVIRVITYFLPPGSSFPEATPGVWFLAFLAAPVALYLRISLAADFAYGLSSFAGYHTTDAFNAPFLAENPITFWQNWNIPFISFLRRAFIFPVAKRRRSLTLTIVMGMLGTVLLHSYIEWTSMGSNLSLAKAFGMFREESVHWAVTGVILYLAVPFYQPVSTKKRSTRIILTIATQCVMFWLLLGTLHNLCPDVSRTPGLFGWR